MLPLYQSPSASRYLPPTQQQSIFGWRDEANEQLHFWQQILGDPDEFDSAPNGSATWYSAKLAKSTFCRRPIKWMRVTVVNSIQPLSIDVKYQLKLPAIRALDREIATIQYTSPSAIVTCYCRNQIDFVAQLYTLTQFNNGEQLHRPAEALEDNIRTLNISYDSAPTPGRQPYNPMARIYAYYYTWLGEGGSSGGRTTASSSPLANYEQEDTLANIEFSETVPRPPVRTAPLNQPRSELEKRNSGASGTIAVQSDVMEGFLTSQLHR